MRLSRGISIFTCFLMICDIFTDIDFYRFLMVLGGMLVGFGSHLGYVSTPFRIKTVTKKIDKTWSIENEGKLNKNKIIFRDKKYAKIVKEMMPNSKFVVLYAKTSGKKQADLHLYDFRDKDWLVFPWEQD